MNLNKNEVDNEVDDENHYNRHHEYYMINIKGGRDYEQDNDYVYKNKEYDDDENKEYDDDENKDYNGEIETFQGAYIDLKRGIFDVGQSLKYKETTEAIYNYAGKNYTPCVRKSIEAMRDMSYHYIVNPTRAAPTSGISITRVQQIIFEQKVKSYVKRVEDHEENMAEKFNVIHGQCTKEFIDQMRTYPDYNQANEESDAIKLLEIIRQISYNHDQEMYRPKVILL